MKISASLTEEDVEFLDKYAEEHRQTRSAALRRAISLLRNRDLGDQYEAAWDADAAEQWESTAADGLRGS